jgi:hypothetical protein
LTKVGIVNARVRIAPIQPVGGVVCRYLEFRVDPLGDVEAFCGKSDELPARGVFTNPWSESDVYRLADEAREKATADDKKPCAR